MAPNLTGARLPADTRLDHLAGFPALVPVGFLRAFDLVIEPGFGLPVTGYVAIHQPHRPVNRRGALEQLVGVEIFGAQPDFVDEFLQRGPQAAERITKRGQQFGRFGAQQGRLGLEFAFYATGTGLFHPNSFNQVNPLTGRAACRL